MKKLIIALLTLVSISAFASSDCQEVQEKYQKMAVLNAQVGASLAIEEANHEVLEIIKSVLDEYPQVNEVSGYDRKSIAAAIDENKNSQKEFQRLIKISDQKLNQLSIMLGKACL